PFQRGIPVTHPSRLLCPFFMFLGHESAHGVEILTVNEVNLTTFPLPVGFQYDFEPIFNDQSSLWVFVLNMLSIEIGDVIQVFGFRPVADPAQPVEVGIALSVEYGFETAN